MHIDLADLHLFLCIVDAGSITQGAARAHLALASASQRLRRIEDDAGLALLERLPRGVRPTAAGEALAHHARVMLAQRALLRDELQDFAAAARGTLHLYANTAALTSFLPPRLAPWLAARPRLQIELKERTSAEIVQLVGSGLAEAGIVSDAVEATTLVMMPVARDQLVLIVARTHPLASQCAVHLHDLLEQPFVGLVPGNALQQHIHDHARALGHPLTLRIRMKTFEGLCQMVANGVGIGIVPQDMACLYQRLHGFHTLALLDTWANRHLCICVRDWQTLSKPMQSLLEQLDDRSTFFS